MPDASHPTVSVVIATREREELLRQTLAGVSGQDYAGDIEVVVVYDQAAPRDEHVRDDPHRRVRVVTNARVIGLAGARNTGMAEATGELVAFCDDDDTWQPTKLRRQVQRMDADGAVACVTGIAIHYGDETHVRIPEVDTITVEALRSSRLTGAHPSSYVMTRAAIDEIGLVDEDLPGGYGEDYDWLLRLAAVGTVSVVREPLVDVLWHRGSYFTSRWATMVESVDYLLEKYPELGEDRVGLGRMRGQRAFALAALGERRRAARAIWETLRTRPLEQRAYAATLVATGVVRADWVMHQANRRGRGI